MPPQDIVLDGRGMSTLLRLPVLLEDGERPRGLSRLYCLEPLRGKD